MELYIDFETRSSVDIKKAGADVYARHETTDILCIGFAFGEEPVDIWTPAGGDDADRKLLRLFAHVGSQKPVVAHNAAFELAIWNHVGMKRYAFPYLNPEQVYCTMAQAYALSLPGSLEKAADAVGIPMKKDMSGRRLMLQLAQPRRVDDDGRLTWWEDPTKFDRLYAYCKQDVEVERQLFKRLLPLSPRERKVWLLDQKINERGVGVDLEAVRTALRLVEFEQERLNHAMQKVTGFAVGACTATLQLTNWLKSRGVKVKSIAKADLSELLNDESLPDDCRAALHLRREAAKSSTAKLTAMLEGVCDDGRMRGLFQYHGAGTGRWAGRRVQLQNLPRPKLKQEEIENVFEVLGGVG